MPAGTVRRPSLYIALTYTCMEEVSIRRRTGRPAVLCCACVRACVHVRGVRHDDARPAAYAAAVLALLDR